MEKAAEGSHVVVRALQEAVKEHFGRGLGTDRACEIVNQVARSTVQMRRERNWSAPERVPTTAEHGSPVTPIIVEAMRQWGVRRIELRDDGSLSLFPI
jgi:hypothetical protein